MLTQLENCTREEFQSFKKDFYVGCSKKTYIRTNKKKTERRQEDRTRILNDKWVEMYFSKPFCQELDKNFHCWVTVTKEKAEEIVLSMEEDQGETIKYIHKYRDEETNAIQYCLAKVKTGGRMRSNNAYSIYKTR